MDFSALYINELLVFQTLGLNKILDEEFIHCLTGEINIKPIALEVGTCCSGCGTIKRSSGELH